MTPFTLFIEKLSDTRTGEQVNVLTFEGELDETNIEEYAPKIYGLIENGTKKPVLVFRLQQLRYMNSKAIGYLTDWSNKIKAKGGRIILAEVPPHINDLLKTIGLEGVFKEYATLEEVKKDLY